jgi:energy-coupling factor transporter ATP-binding protein EcfA2
MSRTPPEEGIDPFGPMDSSPVVSFEGVGMRYGRAPEVLRDISFELERGSFHFLTGPSGAGKSSLLKLIYLAHRPSRGLISLSCSGATSRVCPGATCRPSAAGSGWCSRNTDCWITFRSSTTSPCRCASRG